MTHLVHITTVPKSFLFLRDQIRHVQARGFEVSAITSPGEELAAFEEELGIDFHAVDMPRKISPLRDLATLRRMVALLRHLSPHIVHAHTPKGGLLGMIAATLAGVERRVYHMRGLPVMTATGPKRELLKWTERVSCGLAHQVIAVSHSLREVAIDEGLVSPDKIKVMLGGSGQGVVAKTRFSPALYPDSRATLREKLNIPSDAPVIGFIGRLVRDKGVVELADAFERISENHPEVRLLIVGPFEERDPVPEATRRALEENPRVHMLGWQQSTAPFYTVADIITLPSWREGFPNVPLEAAAMELPVVTTNVAGCIDSVEDGVTGTIVPVRDSEALANALVTYLDDPDLGRAHGRAGRARVLEQFDPEKIFTAIHDEVYLPLLRS